jgi:hypothetical protein
MSPLLSQFRFTHARTTCNRLSLASFLLFPAALTAQGAFSAAPEIDSAPAELRTSFTARDILDRRQALLDAMVARQRGHARALAEELVNLRPRAARPKAAPLAHEIWSQYYVAVLSLQPRDPVRAADLARETVAEITAALPDLPERQQVAAWLMVAGLREHVIGDGPAALAAYESAQAAGGDAAMISAKSERLGRRAGLAPTVEAAR